MSAGSVTALNELFAGDADAKERSTRIRDMIDRVLKSKDREGPGLPELEAILHGYPGPGQPAVTMTQFQRVVGFLRARAARDEDGDQVYMNIQPQGGSRGEAGDQVSRIRATVAGDSAVGEYCETDRLPDGTTYTEKTFMTRVVKDKGRIRESVQDETLGYRVNLKRETTMDPVDITVREMIRGWDRSRKTFRVIQRESFYLGPFRIDCSRVRSGTGRTLEASGVLDSPVGYEIEIELVNGRVISGMSNRDLNRRFLKLVMRLLQILRGSWFLMTKRRQTDALNEYSDITKQARPVERGRKVRLPFFVGPMPVTLERSMISLIRSGEYTVTQKADGERAFLMIDSKGNVNFVYRTMDIESTGLEIRDPSVHKTLLDGEVITRAADGTPIHPPMFLVFDCYMVNGKVVTGLPLVRPDTPEETPGAAAGAAAEASTEDEDGDSRLGLAEMVVNKASTVGEYSVRWGDERHAVRLGMKPFVKIPRATTEADLEDIDRVITGLISRDVPYGTDGLVFTPVREAVRGYAGDSLVQIRGTWSSVMKWKPPEDNTVDFLLRLKKPGESDASVGVGTARGIREGELYVLGDAYTDDMLFDLQDAPDDELRRRVRDSENQAVPFQRGTSRIQLETTAEGAIFAKSGEAVYDDTIVECAWDPTLVSVADETRGGWVVRNVRWDKTASYRRNGDPRGTMNAERTAASVWVTAVEDPVRLEDIWSRDMLYVDEPDGGGEETRDGYFNRKGSRADSLLARMTDFHNLVVKASLIAPSDRTSTRGAVYVDLACGQGGDIPRFQMSEATFVFGMDVEPDNLLNRERGAIKRYLTRRMDSLSGGRRGRRGRVIPMRFALADCGKDLFAARGSDEVFAAIGDKSKEIVRRTLADVAGSGAAVGSASAAARAGDYRSLTIGVGADRVTCMFAVHYFFKDATTVTTFFRNVSRLLRPRVPGSPRPPCFVACCFDGDRVEDLLLEKGGEDRTVSRYVETKGVRRLAWSIRGHYDIEEARENARTRRVGNESLGLRISVYIETINKEHDEYVVRDAELQMRAAEHGLRFATDEEAAALGYPRGSGSFEEMFEAATPRGTGKALHMLGYEKELSFLYRWFVLVPETTD